MKKLITICFLLIGCVSLSAMQQTTLDKHGKTNYQNHEERLKKVEDHLQLDNRYYDHLSSYNVNMYFVAEFLYWSGENEGFGIGYDLSESIDDNDQRIKVLKRDFDYGPAFRVGVGFKPCLDWNIYLSYTRFHHTSKEKYTGDLKPLGVAINEQVYRIDSSFKIKYDILDLEFGRPFHVGQTFTIRPHIGLRGGWIKQVGNNVGYEHLATPVPPEPTTPVYFDNSEKAWVLGTRAGFDIELFFSENYGFSLYGALSGAIMYANVDTLYQGRSTNTAPLPVYYSFLMKENNKDELFVTLQSSLGLSWGDFLTESEDVALCIRAGWEFNYWWDQYASLEQFAIQADRPLSFQELNEGLLIQGLTVSARLDF